MKAILVLLLCLNCFASENIPNSEPKSTKEAKEYGYKIARQVGDELKRGDFLSIARRYDWALDNIIDYAAHHLKRLGHQDLADEAMSDWNFFFRGYLTRMVMQGRGIGDHTPLIQWLSDFYKKVEAAIGRDACKALHISDLHTLNHGIPVVFKPCAFELDGVPYSRKDEYKQHFNGDFSPGGFYGVLPVVVWWTVEVSCMAATSGIAAMLCGPAASIGEYVTYKTFGPKISDFVFDRACSWWGE